jgi:hypothetical protein
MQKFESQKTTKAIQRKWSGFSGFGGGGGGDYPIFLNLCSVVVLMVVVAEAQYKGQDFNSELHLSKGRLHHTNVL